MSFSNRLCWYVALLAAAWWLPSTQSADDVCSFPADKIFTRNATSIDFPPGYQSCKNRPDCPSKCSCRAFQSSKRDGQEFTWALCIDIDNDNCKNSNAPERKLCVAAEATTNDNGKGAGQQDLKALSDTKTKSKRGATMVYLAIGSGMLAIAALAVFVVTKRRDTTTNQPVLGTPSVLGHSDDHVDDDKAFKSTSNNFQQFDAELSDLDDDDDDDDNVGSPLSGQNIRDTELDRYDDHRSRPRLTLASNFFKDASDSFSDDGRSSYGSRITITDVGGRLSD